MDVRAQFSSRLREATFSLEVSDLKSEVENRNSDVSKQVIFIVTNA